MKVVSQDLHLVSNVELAKVLEERGSDSRGDINLGSVAERQVHAYLCRVPTAEVNVSALRDFVEASKVFKLTKKEVLQVWEVSQTSHAPSILC